MKILANDGISQAGIDKLEAAGITVVTNKVEQEDLADTINKEGYVGLLVRSATTARKELIDACPNLLMIGRGGVGMDNIDVDYARSIGRKVFNTPAASSQSVAEMVIGYMFSLSRSLYDSNRQMPKHGATEFKKLKKKYGKGQELRGKTLGIIGFGRIGQATAQYAIGCGMKVIACDRHADGNMTWSMPQVGEVTAQVPIMSTDELISKADYISLHVPKQTNGSAVLGASEFAKMKDGVIIINAARGGVVSEDALLAALESGKVAAAGLDVFDNEPTPRQDILSHPKIASTPHVGAATGEAQDRIGAELAEQILEILKVKV